MAATLATKASQRFSRHLAVSTNAASTPRFVSSAFGTMDGTSIHGNDNDGNNNNNSNNNRRRGCYQNYSRGTRHFSTASSIIGGSTSTSTTGTASTTSKNANNIGADDEATGNKPDQPREPTPIEKTDKNIFQRMFQKYSVSEQKNRILMAESLFQAATSQASDPRWYGPGGIGRDFRSYQAVMTMHVWLLHKRLLADATDPHEAALVQEELFDIFWIDSSNRMRAHGVNEMLVTKNLKQVQQYTFMHMFHYDHCYSGDLLDNPSDRLEALKMTIKRHVLLLPSLTDDEDDENGNGDESAVDEDILRKHVEHDDQAERIAWYIETQFQNIVHDLPDSFFQKARIAWVDLPSFDRMIDGNTGKELPQRAIDPEDLLPLGWTKSIANDGSYYYWNTKTREAVWDRPL